MEALENQETKNWAALKERFATVFATRTRAEWCAVFDPTDACVAPVLSPLEAPDHPHHRARRGFLVRDGVPQPAPAPRFSAHQRVEPTPPEHPGAATSEVLAGWGVRPDDVDLLQAAGVLV